MLSGKRPRTQSMDGLEAAESPSSKRSMSQEVEESSALGGGDSDELVSESAHFDKMDIAATASTSARPLADQQREAIMPLMSAALQPNQSYYVVKRAWYRAWQAAVHEGQLTKDETPITIDEIPPIDNTGLQDEHGRLSELPRVDENIVIVDESVYSQWKTWYGEQGHGVMRRTIMRGLEPVIEYFPPTIHCSLVFPEEPAADVDTHNDSFEMSATDTVGRLRAFLYARMRLPGDVEKRWWRYNPPPDILAAEGATGPFMSRRVAGEVAPTCISAHEITEGWQFEGKKWQAFDKLEGLTDQMTLMEAQLDDVDVYIIVEMQDDNEKWLVTEPEAPPKPQPYFGGGGHFADKSSPATNGMTVKYKSKDAATAPVAGPSTSLVAPSRIATRSQTGSATRTPGLLGLQNLGNTCFMNSALQCLSNTPELKRYFQSGAWDEELNPDNPLGMDGKVATSFANLIRDLWSGTGNSYVTPREFKQTIGKFRPMFLGWSQQDSQELIAFLLDGLHEDLNRIRRKPYTEIPDWDGEPTPMRMYEHAERIWNLYRQRNDSVMVDLFFGQFRSTLTCLECHKVSYKFDEFSSVTLSLPKKPAVTPVHVVPLDPSKPRWRVLIQTAPDASLRDLRVKVGKIIDADPKRLVPLDAWGQKVYAWLPDYKAVNSIGKQDITVMYELPMSYSLNNPPRNKKALTMAERDAEDGNVVVPVGHLNAKSTFGSFSTVGWPVILGLKTSEVTSYDAVYNAIARQVARFSRAGDRMFEYEDDDETMREYKAGEQPTLPPHSVALQNLFKIMVSKRTDTQLPPAPDYGSGGAFIELKKRISQRAEEQKPLGPIPGAFPPSSGDVEVTGATEDVPMQAEGEGETGAVEKPTAAPQPVISTGDSIFLEWNNGAWRKFFGEGGSLFESWEDMQDPDIEQTKEAAKNRMLSLDSCLTDFCQPERLGEDNPWKCPVCNKLQENTEKQMDLWKVPDILIVHLKRFSKSGGYSWQKTTDTVDFPLENWDLTQRVESRRIANQLKQTEEGRSLLGEDFEDKPLLYDLFAVDNHYGGMGGGHYTAYAKNETDGRWYHFDDTNVSPVSDPEAVKTNAAYLLFYRRQTSRELGSKKTSEIIAEAIQSRSISSIGGDDVMPALGVPAQLNGNGTRKTEHGLLTPPDEDELQQQREQNRSTFIGPPIDPLLTASSRENSWTHLPMSRQRRVSNGSNDAELASDEEVSDSLLEDVADWPTGSPSKDDDDDDLPTVDEVVEADARQRRLNFSEGAGIRELPVTSPRRSYGGEEDFVQVSHDDVRG